jgi:hypothetical protein
MPRTVASALLEYTRLSWRPFRGKRRVAPPKTGSALPAFHCTFRRSRRFTSPHTIGAKSQQAKPHRADRRRRDLQDIGDGQIPLWRPSARHCLPPLRLLHHSGNIV